MTFNPDNQARHSDGTFGEKIGAAATVALTADTGTENHRERLARELNERRARLQKEGYAAATAQVAIADVRRTARDEDQREKWWDQNFVTGEFAPEGAGSYELMPDDYTPGMHYGRSAEGNRRTHRMLYEGAGVAVRMPSATAIKRFSAEKKNRTFDVPVSVEVDGEQVAAHVRITKNGPNQWGVSALGLKGLQGEKVSEAVSAVLEARRPSVALRQVDDLIERRRERLAQAGAKMVPVKSQFIESLGYNEAGNEMYINMGGQNNDGSPRRYAYRVPRDVFHTVANAESIGKAYNDFIKKGGAPLVAGGKDNPVQVAVDEKTGRFYNPARGFRFSQHGQADGEQKPARTVALKRALGIPTR